MSEADRAREQARDILSDGRFEETDLPQPLRGPFERLGDLLEDLAGPVTDAFEELADALPGGGPAAALVLGALVVAAAAVVAARLATRRGEQVRRAARAAGAPRESAAALRRAAADAERAGDLDAALRLRFRAGLLELGERELIELHPALPNREVRALRSPTLDGLLTDFEEVAYGGRPAQPADLDSAREGWPRVPAEVAR